MGIHISYLDVRAIGESDDIQLAVRRHGVFVGYFVGVFWIHFCDQGKPGKTQTSNHDRDLFCFQVVLRWPFVGARGQHLAGIWAQPCPKQKTNWKEEGPEGFLRLIFFWKSTFLFLCAGTHREIRSMAKLVHNVPNISLKGYTSYQNVSKTELVPC